MIPPKGEWTKFIDEKDRISHYIMWGFSKLTTLIFYGGRYSDKIVPCEVVGHQNDKWAVIKVGDSSHCIHGEYLHELQAQHKTFDGIPSEYVVLDVEATTKAIPIAKIIEIAAIKYKDGVETACFSTLVNPKHKIPASSTKIHGITDDDVKDAPEWSDIQAPFFEFIGDLPIVGHNTLFDIEVIQYHCRSWIYNMYIDTYQRARKAFPLEQELAKGLGIENHRLEHLKGRLGLSSGPSHRALEDARTTNALLWACENPASFAAEQ